MLSFNCVVTFVWRGVYDVIDCSKAFFEEIYKSCLLYFI